MPVTKTRWKNVDTGVGTDRFECTISDSFHRQVRVVIKRSRVKNRKARYGWSINVHGTGSYPLEYWGESIPMVKKLAQEFLNKHNPFRGVSRPSTLQVMKMTCK